MIRATSIFGFRSSRGRRALSVGFFVFVCLAAGCGPKMVTVTGAVQYEGKPVESGEISFIAQDGSRAPTGAVITDGRYSVVLSPGEKTVRIRASRPIPAERRNPHDPAGLREDFLPAKFNDDSRITATVRREANQTLNFNLDE
jgi:hypothetical protein